MPPRPLTPEEEAARAQRYAELEERNRRRRGIPARQEGIETVTTEAQVTEAVEVIEEMPLNEPGELPPEPELELEAPGPQTPFEVYLAMLPPETRDMLTEEELLQFFEDSERDAKEERRKQLRQQARDRAKETARAAAGLLTPEEVERARVRERMAKRVRVTPRLPFVSDTGGVVAQGVTIDGVMYMHGQEATMPLGRALDMRHILYSLQQNELDFEGKGRLHGLRRQQAESVNMVRF